MNELKGLVILFWIMDIINLPFMEMFDTQFPLNFWFWVVAFIAMSMFDD